MCAQEIQAVSQLLFEVAVGPLIARGGSAADAFIPPGVQPSVTGWVEEKTGGVRRVLEPGLGLGK